MVRGCCTLVHWHRHLRFGRGRGRHSREVTGRGIAGELRFFLRGPCGGEMDVSSMIIVRIEERYEAKNKGESAALGG